MLTWTNTDDYVNTRQMNHVCENNGSGFTVALSLVEGSDKAEKMLAHKEEEIREEIGTSQLVRRGFFGKTECQMLFNSRMKQV